MEKCNKIFSRVNHVTGKDLDIEVVYVDEYMATKIKSYKDETDFNDKWYPPEKCKSIAYSIIHIDSVYRTDKSYYPQELPEECKHSIRENTVKIYNWRFYWFWF